MNIYNEAVKELYRVCTADIEALGSAGRAAEFKEYLKNKVLEGSLLVRLKGAGLGDKRAIPKVKKEAGLWAKQYFAVFCFELLEKEQDFGASKMDSILWDIAVLWVNRYKSEYAGDKSYIQAVRRALSHVQGYIAIAQAAEADLIEQANKVVAQGLDERAILDMAGKGYNKAVNILVDSPQGEKLPAKFVDSLKNRGNTPKGIKAGAGVVESVKPKALKSVQAQSGKELKVYVTAMNEVIASVIRLLRGKPVFIWTFITPSGGHWSTPIKMGDVKSPYNFLDWLYKNYKSPVVDIEMTKYIQFYALDKLLLMEKEQRFIKIADIKNFGLAARYAQQLGIKLVSKVNF